MLTPFHSRRRGPGETNDTRGLEDETHLLCIFELRLQLQIKYKREVIIKGQGVGTARIRR